MGAYGTTGVNSVLSTWTTIAWHKLLQWLIDTEIPLEKVELQHEIDSPFADYASMFCGNCVFNRSTNRLVFARSYLNRRVVRLPNEGDHLRATTPGYFAIPGLLARSWNQLVRSILHRQLSEGNALSTVEQLAQELGISGQTLRRRLRAEGISYRKLKAEARLETARHVIVDLNRDRGTPHDAPPPTPPGIRITYHGGSVD